MFGLVVSSRKLDLVALLDWPDAITLRHFTDCGPVFVRFDIATITCRVIRGRYSGQLAVDPDAHTFSAVVHVTTE